MSGYRGPSLTEEQRELVKTMFLDGGTAPQIAAALWRHYEVAKTRSAICGVLNRMGLRVGGPRVHPKPAEKARKPAAPRRPRCVQPKHVTNPGPTWFGPKVPAPEVTPVRAPDAQPTGLLDLRWDQCRQVIDKGSDGLALYCGAPARDGSSWCRTCGDRFLRRVVVDQKAAL